MKQLTLLSILLLTISNSSYAGCEKAYMQKANKMRPESLVGSTAVGIGGFIVAGAPMVGTIMLGAGPVGLIPGTGALMAYSNKADRMEFFSRLIKGANKFVAQEAVGPAFFIPQDLVGMSFIKGDLRMYDRLKKEVFKFEPEATDEQILRAISRADSFNSFCSPDLITNFKQFSYTLTDEFSL